MKTPRQKENIREALRMWATVPPENVAPNLLLFRKDDPRNAPTCNTIACFGGWLPYWPAFEAMGVRVGSFGAPKMRGCFWADQVSLLLFGERAAFNSRGEHDADVGFIGTDHALVTNRLHWMLNHD